MSRAACPRRGAWLVAAASALVLVLPAGAASAATFQAKNSASLQAAVASADASSGSSTIELSAGVFLPTSTLSISRDVTIAGPSSAPGAELAGSSVEPFPSDLLLVEAHAKLTLSNVEVTASGGGVGASGIDDFGTVDLESSTVAGNDGSGVHIHPGASASLQNATLSDGLAFGLIDDGTAILLNSTVAENEGGGIDDSEGTLELTNTIVAENGSSNCTKPAKLSDHSLDSDGSCGVGLLSRTDPGLGTLDANGGPTSTQALGAGSPAIDAGDDSRCPADDQRHFVRPSGDCDLGAYQTDALRPGTPTGGPGSGSGSAPSSGGSGSVLSGVNAHGTLLGARRSRITFTVRAEAGRTIKFLYTDGARRAVLHALAVKSLAIDWRRGTATLRGNVEMPSRRRVSMTMVLVSHAGQRSLRIRLSNGYYESGRLLNGSIAFTRRTAR